ncbi:MAG: hypothetical protein AAF298_08510 [Cyanobacteria bacterium P01_A01_bin.40]
MTNNLWITSKETTVSWMTDEDWLNLGKSDAWAGKPKSAPENDVLAASMYDLGYSEGSIEKAPEPNGR